jgi:lysyl-tRNA synthetase class 2
VSVAWQPTASLAALRQRAVLLGRVREFMAARKVLEVETPALVQRAVTDTQLYSAEVELPGISTRLFLHTSPEFAMKRLLAAGSGDIYQLCKVYRGAERSALHNAEFTLLEWYRTGMSMQGLMGDVEALLQQLLAPRKLSTAARLRYDVALRQFAQVDLGTDSNDLLVERCVAAGLAAQSARRASRDELLDFLMAVVVGPQLGTEGPEFLTHYPASQAALARLDPEDPRYALRFELYWQGIELANGFEELADAAEQARRFEADRTARARLGLRVHPSDERFLAALAHGLPPCAGVALGFDRLVMLALGARELGSVMSFTLDRA